MVDLVGSCLKREAGLADAAWAEQRHQAALVDQLRDRCQFVFAADEAGKLGWEVVRSRVQRAEWREVRPQIRVLELKDVLRFGQVLEPMGASVQQDRAGAGGCR